ncbi:MAG: UDP-2,4-diacetamido-2,4,6-trideoxy-beta-L-altropyranose hydrolase, partial [Acidaminococcaceae bacterium]
MIVFRVDASTQIGSGHLMRCLTLANKLVKDSEIVFICRQLIGNLVELIEQQGYVVHILSSSEPAEQALTGY